jgi:hypothetical protein
MHGIVQQALKTKLKNSRQLVQHNASSGPQTTTALIQALGTHSYQDRYVRLHLNHATEFSINECCYHLRWQGVGNVRCEARGYIIADSIHRKRGWKGESVVPLGLTHYEPLPNQSFYAAIRNQGLEQFDEFSARHLPAHRRATG